MSQIEKHYLINASVNQVWKALTYPSIIEKWSGSKAQMSEENGTDFSLWDGDIHGTNTKVEKYKLLEQDWYGGDWSEPSKVVFQISGTDHKTELTLLQDGAPKEEVDNLDTGWDDYYLGAIQDYLESATEE